MKYILVLIISLSNISVFACICTCKKERPVENAFENHESILHGKVISITLVSIVSAMNEKKRDSLMQIIGSNHDRLIRALDYKGILKVEVEVIKRFKGKSDRSIAIIYTSPHGESCGYPKFIVNEEFLIYGSVKSYRFLGFQTKGRHIKYEKENTFWTSRCYRTKKYLKSEAMELEALMD